MTNWKCLSNLQSCILGGQEAAPLGVHCSSRFGSVPVMKSYTLIYGSQNPYPLRPWDRPNTWAPCVSAHNGAVFFVRIDSDPSTVLPFYLFTCTYVGEKSCSVGTRAIATEIIWMYSIIMLFVRGSWVVGTFTRCGRYCNANSAIWRNPFVYCARFYRYFALHNILCEQFISDFNR